MAPFFISFIFILLTGKYNPIQIATYKVSRYNAQINGNDLHEMCFPERERHTEIIEDIRNAMGKSAHYEQWNAEQKRKELFPTREMYSCRHNESAAYPKKTALERTGTDPRLKDSLSGRLDSKRRNP